MLTCAVGSTQWITNQISESDNGLLITFTFHVEASSASGMTEAYKSAVRKTLEVTRNYVKEGKI